MRAALQRAAIALAALGAGLLSGCAGDRTPAWTMQPPPPGQNAAGTAAVSYTSYYALGRYRQQRGELDAAASAFQQAIALAPHERDARNALAVLYAERGQLAPAQAMLAQLNADFPQQASLLSNLGYVDYLRGDHGGAVAALRQALALDAAQPHVRANLALAERALRDSGAGDLASRARLADAGSGRAATVTTAATIVPVPSPLDLVQLAPHEFRLQPHASVPAAAGAALQIINGYGVRDAGLRVQRVLGSYGIASGRVLEQRRHYQRRTIIEYLPGQHSQALALQAALRGHATLILRASLPNGSAMRLVLGHDLLPHLALIDSAARRARLSAEPAAAPTV